MKLHFAESILRPFKRGTLPGAAPGTVIARHDETKPVIHAIAFSDGNLFDKDIDSLDELHDLTASYDVTWINVEGLGDTDVISGLGEMFGLHKLAMEDVVNVHQRAKVEDYGDHLFIVARMIDATKRLQTEQICFFVGRNYVLTFQEGKPGDCLDPVRHRIRNSIGHIRHRGTDYLTYALLDSIIDHYFPVVESYGDRLDALDGELTETQGDAPIAGIHSFRSDLLVIRRAIRPHREAISELLRDSHELISDETRIFLRDCYDHTAQLIEAIDTYRQSCSDLRDFHLAAVSNRTNDVMKTLTFIATIFIPLSFIAGVYGMNFDYMPELHWRFGYPFAFGLMAAVVIGLLFWFRHKGWFRR